MSLGATENALPKGGYQHTADSYIPPKRACISITPTTVTVYIFFLFCVCSFGFALMFNSTCCPGLAAVWYGVFFGIVATAIIFFASLGIYALVEKCRASDTVTLNGA